MGETDWVNQVSAEYATGRRLLLAFDFDGTLAPIVAHPDLAAVPPATLAALESLAALDRVVVGVISGRALGNLRGCVGLAAVWYGGSGGMHLDLGGEEIIDAGLSAFDRVAESLVPAVAAVVGKHAGAWVERKPGCLSVHFRALTPLGSAVLMEDVRDLVGGLGAKYPPLRVRVVSMAIEVALAAAWTKDDAVGRMHAAHGGNPLVVYAGDGANDEEAVDWVNARRGVTVGIGPDAPWAAQVRLPTPADLAQDLERLRAGCARRPRVAE